MAQANSTLASQARRAELHRTIWKIATELRGSVDGIVVDLERGDAS
ncbi:MAG: hypothetical protein LBV00_01985 [Propionibacteriaceae bacterium]|nr:hypothetical protein [Propionibacteriaceae bacterium]